MPLINKTKTHTTRFGRPVRLYDFWTGSRLPVVGAVQHRGEWQFARWTEEGFAYGPSVTSNDDLIEVVEETKGKGETNYVESNLNCY